MAGDKTYITDGQGKQHRATRVHAVTPTDIVWSSNPNDYTVQVKINGEWHRAVLTMDAGVATFFENLNIDKGLIVGADGKSHTALIVKPESTVTLSSIKTDEHALVNGTTTGETAVVTYEENWSDVKYQDNINVYKVLVTGSDGKVHTALLTTSSGGAVEVIVVGPGIAPLSLPDAIANSLTYVKAYGGTEQRNVPDGYTQLEYIEATDLTTTYIDTGVSFSNCAKSVIQLEEVNYGQDGTIFFSGGRGIPYIGIYYNNTIVSNSLVSPNCTITGNTITFTWTGASIEKNVNIFGWTASSWSTEEKLQLVQLYDSNDVLLFNGVPAKRNSDNVLGMYDTVTGTFFTNAGTGAFTAGPEVVPTPDAPMDIVCNNGVLKVRHTSGLPLEYEQVEYLESSGGQYLDTGVVLKGETLEVDCDFAFATVPTVDSVPRVIWGFMGPNSLPRAALFGYQGKFSYGSNNTSSLAIFIDTNKHSSVFYANENGSSCSFMFDGYGYTGTGTPSSYAANNLSIYLFARNNDTTGVGNWSISRIYSGMKFKLDNVVVRDYITCRRLSDNALGMYDLVNKTFITNLGTGTFTAGSTVADPAEVYVDGVVETIWAHGKNLFDKNNANILDAFISSVGSVTTSGNDKFIYLQVEAGKTYYVSFTGNGAGRASFFDSVPSIGSQGVSTRNFYTSAAITVPAGMSYFGFHFNTNSVSLNDMLNTLQIELGNAATPYEPYYNGGTATCENLLSIGDYTDVQEVITGDVTRKVGVKVLDGTEDVYNGAAGYWGISATYFPDIKMQTTGALLTTCWTEGSYISPTGAYCSIAGIAYFAFNKASLPNASTTTDVKQWFADQYAAGTPVIIVYPLTTETTESVAGQTLNVTDGDNVIDITQASISGLELEAEYTKVS